MHQADIQHGDILVETVGAEARFWAAGEGGEATPLGRSTVREGRRVLETQDGREVREEPRVPSPTQPGPAGRAQAGAALARVTAELLTGRPYPSATVHLFAPGFGPSGPVWGSGERQGYISVGHGEG